MPPRRAQPRCLTLQQLKNPLIRGAYERLGQLVSRRGLHLRRLDSLNGDRRTRIEVFRALEEVREQLLVRLDLATSVLGYLDEVNGQFVLNTQRGIAEDSGVSAPVLCRLFQNLEKVGYAYRRIERVRLDEKDENGLHLVRTRVLVRFTKLFWNDLGLRYVQERVQKSAKKRREAELRGVAQRELAKQERYSLEQHRREVSRQRWQAKEARQADANAAQLAPVSAKRTSDAGSSRSKPVTGQDVLKALDKLLANKPGAS
ncbi:hypothetical protein [Pseudomonas protegens]|uniref:hypothetical protein n=1 Tax=Pseudomonas protegens TaxID=380021 RepID=UPI00215A0018|nr:hypothetical protein [Pseudomonas protegens]